MNTNHQIFASPLPASYTDERSIRRKAALQTSLVLAFALSLFMALLAMTSCQSPINIDTARTITPDVIWRNSGGLTAVATLQGKEPDVKLQLERMVATTNGTTYVTMNFKGDFTPNAGLEKLVRDVPYGYIAGKINLNGQDFSIATGANRQLVNFSLLWAPPIAATDKLSANVSLNDLSLNDNNIIIPETRRITSANDNTTIKASENLTIQLDKPAEEGAETEVLFYSNDYRVTPIIKSIAPGTNSVTLNSTDFKEYIDRLSQSSTNPNATQWASYFLAVRVKAAKSTNDGKVALAGVSTFSVRLLKVEQP